MTIDEARAHIGHAVTRREGTPEAEDGVITSVSATRAFVRYGEGPASMPADPADLTLLSRTHPEPPQH